MVCYTHSHLCAFSLTFQFLSSVILPSGTRHQTISPLSLSLSLSLSSLSLSLIVSSLSLSLSPLSLSLSHTPHTHTHEHLCHPSHHSLSLSGSCDLSSIRVGREWHYEASAPKPQNWQAGEWEAHQHGLRTDRSASSALAHRYQWTHTHALYSLMLANLVVLEVYVVQTN